MSILYSLVEALSVYIEDTLEQKREQLVEQTVCQQCIFSQHANLQLGVHLTGSTFGKRLGDVCKQYSCSDVTVAELGEF